MKFGQLMEYPTNIYLFQVNNRNIRKRCETCLKLTIKSLIVNFEHIWRRSVVFIVNFEHILHLFLVFCIVLFWASKYYLAITWEILFFKNHAENEAGRLISAFFLFL